MASVMTTVQSQWPHRRMLLAALVVSLVLNVCFVAGVAWLARGIGLNGLNIIQRLPLLALGFVSGDLDVERFRDAVECDRFRSRRPATRRWPRRDRPR